MVIRREFHMGLYRGDNYWEGAPSFTFVQKKYLDIFNNFRFIFIHFRSILNLFSTKFSFNESVENIFPKVSDNFRFIAMYFRFIAMHFRSIFELSRFKFCPSNPSDNFLGVF